MSDKFDSSHLENRSLDKDFSVSPNISFSATIDLTYKLLERLEHTHDNDDSLITSIIAQLLQTRVGARGFLATYLTYGGAIADNPPTAFIEALQTAPTLVADLMVKNLAMSSAMIIAHQRKNDLENVSGSQRVQNRTRELIAALSTQELSGAIKAMLSSLKGLSEQYRAFFQQQQYDAEQRHEIQRVLTALIATRKDVTNERT
ncbi:MAG: hypothetical protein AAGA75_06830 [Cyanobacteria bacterium P01_E01_bin.6]